MVFVTNRMAHHIFPIATTTASVTVSCPFFMYAFVAFVLISVYENISAPAAEVVMAVQFGLTVFAAAY